MAVYTIVLLCLKLEILFRILPLCLCRAQHNAEGFGCHYSGKDFVQLTGSSSSEYLLVHTFLSPLFYH